MAFSFIIFLLALFWIYFYLRLASLGQEVTVIDDYRLKSKTALPGLTVIIAACNEELTIEPAIKTLLAQDYPGLQLIVVNDRSTDNTPLILKRLEKLHPHLKVIHIKELPEGWLGKVHALHQAVSKVMAAKKMPEYVLFTDADIHFTPGALKKAVAYAREHKLDHLTIAPYMVAESFLLKTMFSTFSAIFTFFTIGLPKALRDKNAIGIGAFNLVKLSAFKKTPGFEWLKMEVADDVGLALMLKKAGAVSAVSGSRKDISISWYHSVAEMTRGLEKNIFGAGSGYNLLRAMLQFTLGILFAAAPFLALFSGHFQLQITGVLALAAFLNAVIMLRRDTFFPSLLIPLGQMILVYILLRAGILCVFRGGIRWRGTLYKTADLKKGQRVRIGI